jgi:ceramide glucosyltransferase
VSILKPIRGADAAFAEAIRTQAGVDYPEFEILFGLRDRNDPARVHIEKLQRQYPHRAIRIVECSTDAPNAKVGTLTDLAAAARHPVLVVNDSDISVPRDYLRTVVAELAQPGVGLVTCLYRAAAESFPSRLEALGIATDFAPSALVAPAVGVREFGLGSTLAFRAETLARMGGFSAIRDYIADDYQAGKRIAGLGLTVWLSRIVVATHMDGGWKAIWDHQVRWARTIRLSQGGYYGLPVTFATLWALVAFAAGSPGWGLVLLLLRLLSGLVAGVGVLRDPLTARMWPLIPVRDLFGVAVWLAGLGGSTVIWRGRRLHLDRLGRIENSAPLG